jgi:hypothetical protein
MTISTCPRCGKVKHQGKCTFTTGKKSIVETLSDDMKTVKEKVK